MSLMHVPAPQGAFVEHAVPAFAPESNAAQPPGLMSPQSPVPPTVVVNRSFVNAQQFGQLPGSVVVVVVVPAVVLVVVLPAIVLVDVLVLVVTVAVVDVVVGGGAALGHASPVGRMTIHVLASSFFSVPPAAPPNATQYESPPVIVRMKPPSSPGFGGTTASGPSLPLRLILMRNVPLGVRLIEAFFAAPPVVLFEYL